MDHLESILSTIVDILIPLIILIVIFRVVASALRGAQRHSGTVSDSYQGIFYVIQQQHVGVIERLGKFHSIVNPGFHVRIPIVDRVRVTRETVGPDVDIIIENHSYLDANTAIQFAQAIEPYNIMYFEEPNTPDPDTAVRLAEKINIPIASGERIYTRWQYEKYFEKNALHVAQPDIGTCGGITEVKKICDLAYIHDAAIQVHICGTPICVAAGLHVEAAIPNFVIHEHHQCNLLPDHIKLCKYDYQPVNGKYKVPELPGIGQELSDWVLTNTEYVERVTVTGKAAAWVMADVGKE